MPSISPPDRRQATDFKSAYHRVLPMAAARRIFAPNRPSKGRPPRLGAGELVMALVFHCLQGCGTLAGNARILLRKSMAESSMSERRQSLPWAIFEAVMEAALAPRANAARKHPQSFYNGLRLVAIDGTQFSVGNTPAILASLSKAASRRMKAAFAKVGVAMLVELGVHNPLAAAIAREGESELCLARRLLASLPERSLLIADRLYGVGAFLVDLVGQLGGRSCHFLVRVRGNLKPRLLERCRDGSALVEVKVSGTKRRFTVREVRGRVRCPRGQWVDVRFWTSLLDAGAYPARELLALYARRWEQEIMYKEIKVDMRDGGLLNSHTVGTAAQEIAALVIAHAILAQERLRAAGAVGDDVLRISFGKTLTLVRSLWLVLAATQGILDPKQTAAMTRRVMRTIAETALPKRRKRSCPRAVRQPVGSWPRLTKNTYSTGATEYKPTKIPA